MEFTRDIFFSDKLVENKEAKITYSGKLFKNGSENVTIVFGYGENWDNTQEKQMERTSNGFETSIVMLKNFDTFNFCFRDSNYVWDNNNSFNYISPISIDIEENSNLADTSSNNTQSTEENNDMDLILNILDALLDENLNSHPYESSSAPMVLESNDKQQVLDDILAETLNNTIENESIENVNTDYSVYEIQNFDMDKLVSDILTPVINCSTVAEEESKNIQNITITASSPETEKPKFSIIEVIENEIENPSTEFFVSSQDASTEEENIDNRLSTLAQALPEKNAELINEINNIDLIEEVENQSESNIDEPSLLDIINFIESPEGISENVQNIQKQNAEENNFVHVSDGNYLVSPRQLSKFYLMKKKIKLSFCKLFKAIPRILSNTFEENDNK